MSNMPHNDDNNNNCDENGNPLPPGISTAVFRASDDLTGRCLACKLNVGTCNREDIYDAVLKEHGVHCKCGMNSTRWRLARFMAYCRKGNDAPLMTASSLLSRTTTPTIKVSRTLVSVRPEEDMKQ
jgi:hypothetical protein